VEIWSAGLLPVVIILLAGLTMRSPYTIQLEVVPINGRIVLRHPIEDPASPALEEEKDA